MKDAPFNKRDPQLVPTAGSCAECPKRTGHNKLLFGNDLGKQGTAAPTPPVIRPKCRPMWWRLSPRSLNWFRSVPPTAHRKEGSSVLPRNKYTAIRDDKSKSKDEALRPEFKVCKYTTETIIAKGSDIGTIHKVCANPACPSIIRNSQ